MKLFKKYLSKLKVSSIEDYNKKFKILFEYNPNARLVDLGCDNGTSSKKIAEIIGTKAIDGLDLIEERIPQAILNGVNAYKADLNKKLPIKDESYDVVFSNQVIEHLYDTDMFLEEIYRILRPNGYAVICTENLSSWHNIFSLIFGWMPFSLSNVTKHRFQIGNPLTFHNNEPMTNPNTWQHIRVFSLKGLIDICKLNSFEVEDFYGSGYYPFPGFLAKADPTHSAFITLKIRKKQ